MSEIANNDAAAHPRVFLVVVDDSEEMRVALRFAGQRAKHTGGRVARFEKRYGKRPGSNQTTGAPEADAAPADS